jgi:hypothetical protein
MQQQIITTKLDGYRWDFSWYQFKWIREKLAKSGFIELGRIATPRKPSSVKKADSGVMVLGTRDLKPNIVMPRGEKPRIVENIGKSNWANAGEILVAEVGGEISVGTTALVTSDLSFWSNLGFSAEDGRIAVSSDINILSVDPPSDAGFVSTFLNSRLGRHQLRALSFTTKQTRVRSYELNKIMIPAPKNGIEYTRAIETMNSALLKIRGIVDLEIPKDLGVDPEATMRTARPYMERVRKSELRG